MERDGPPETKRGEGGRYCGRACLCDTPFETFQGVDQHGRPLSRRVAVERPLTIYLNATKVFTTMTMCGNHDLLAIGHLINRGLLPDADRIESVEYDADFSTVIVRARVPEADSHRTVSRLAASGRGLGDLYYETLGLIDSVSLDTACRFQASSLRGMDQAVARLPSVHGLTGAIHGCALFEEDEVVVFMEDIERLNAMDKVSGYMRMLSVPPEGKLLYTTGRLTSETVLKTVLMEVPVLVSSSGFTGYAVELARCADLTLIGYAQGEGFQVLSGAYRIDFDLPGSTPTPD